MNAVEDFTEPFTIFVKEVETRLRHALVAVFGQEQGREATAEALAFAWEHWDRVGDMDNPAGYLYRVGRSRGQRRRQRPVFGGRLSLRHRQTMRHRTHQNMQQLRHRRPRPLDRTIQRGPMK